MIRRDIHGREVLAGDLLACAEQHEAGVSCHRRWFVTGWDQNGPTAINNDNDNTFGPAPRLAVEILARHGDHPGRLPWDFAPKRDEQGKPILDQPLDRPDDDERVLYDIHGREIRDGDLLEVAAIVPAEGRFFCTDEQATRRFVEQCEGHVEILRRHAGPPWPTCTDLWTFEPQRDEGGRPIFDPSLDPPRGRRVINPDMFDEPPLEPLSYEEFRALLAGVVAREAPGASITTDKLEGGNYLVRLDLGHGVSIERVMIAKPFMREEARALVRRAARRLGRAVLKEESTRKR